jgi:DNA-binding CsgD family transcriptional regulator
LNSNARADALVDRIYEAAMVPGIWPDVMERLAAACSAALAALMVSGTDRWMGSWAGWISNAQMTRAGAALMNGDIARRTQLTPRLLASDRPYFLADGDLYSEEEWQSDPLCGEWAAKWGLGNSFAAAFFRSPTGEITVIHLQRASGCLPFSSPELDLLNFIHPHIARAVLLAARWRLEKQQTAVEALAAIGLPALICDRQGRVLAANRLIDGTAGYVKWLPMNRVALVDPVANRTFRLGLSGLADPASPAMRSFAVRPDSALSPVVAHLIPTPRLAGDPFDGACGVLLMSAVNAPTAPNAALIRDLFDLTPHEARAAQGITAGLTVNEIAARHGVGRETIRSQVKAVLAKTGTRHQAAAASLLRGLPKFPVVGE